MERSYVSTCLNLQTTERISIKFSIEGIHEDFRA
jgi:hypothetical protein